MARNPLNSKGSNSKETGNSKLPVFATSKHFKDGIFQQFNLPFNFV